MSGSAVAGDCLTVASESTGFATYFGEAPTVTSSVASINGDDAVELFQNGEVVDVLGDQNVDGTGQGWEYMDGWAYRNSGSLPSSTFGINDWTFSGTNAVDGCTTNSGCGSQFPFKSFFVSKFIVEGSCSMITRLT